MSGDAWFTIMLMVWFLLCYIGIVMEEGILGLPTHKRGKRKARKREMIARRNADLLTTALNYHAVAVKERQARHLAELNAFNEQAGFDPEPAPEEEELIQPEPEPEYPSAGLHRLGFVDGMTLFQQEPKVIERAVKSALDWAVEQNPNYRRGQLAKSTDIHYSLGGGQPICAPKNPYGYSRKGSEVTCPTCRDYVAALCSREYDIY